MAEGGRARVSLSSIYELYRKKVWDARIPLCIAMAPEELHRALPRSTAQELCQAIKARPFFVLAPRTGYLPLLLTELRRHYHPVFSAMEEALGGPAFLAPWLECDGHPLAWHYPTGHLFDELHCWHPARATCPWMLTLHLTDYPRATLLPNNYAGQMEEEGGGGGAIGRHFYAMLKQADYIRHASCKAINALSKSEQIQLWDGLWTHSFDKFWRISAKLLGDDPARTWRGIPLKIYLKGDATPRRIFQAPLQLPPSGLMTVLEALALVLGPAGGGAEELPHRTHRIYIHGIEIPPETSIAWLATYFAYPDGFLHLILGPAVQLD